MEKFNEDRGEEEEEKRCMGFTLSVTLFGRITSHRYVPLSRPTFSLSLTHTLTLAHTHIHTLFCSASDFWNNELD